MKNKRIFWLIFEIGFILIGIVLMLYKLWNYPNSIYSILNGFEYFGLPLFFIILGVCVYFVELQLTGGEGE